MARPYIVKSDNYTGYFKSGKAAVLKYRQYVDCGKPVMIGNRKNGAFMRSRV